MALSGDEHRGGHHGDLGVVEREDSAPDSQLSGEFMHSDPKFDSPPGSSTSDSELMNLGPQAPLVTVVWRQLTVTTKAGPGLWGRKFALLKSVSGYVEPRTVLAVVGPARSGKSALVAALSGHLHRPAQAYGEVLINGVPPQQSSIKPTYFSAWDEPMTSLTIEQVLIYTALLKWQDQPKAALEQEVRKVCQMLGLLGDLGSLTHKLSSGLQRRVTVACQLVGSSPLLVLHDALEGVHEGDALAIMRAVHECARNGSTAIVQCQQPTTDICSFFTRAFVLCGGEVVYFGETGTQAVQLLGAAGMPCPPLYSPLEQFMRLIDPTFEVYLQVAQTGEAQDWNARFSGMMFKVLQDSYASSGLAKESEARTQTLASLSPDRSGWHPKPLPAWRQVFVLMRRLVSQGLRCFPLYLSRIILGALIAIVYGASYSNLTNSFTDAQGRLAVFAIITAFLPLLALTSLPVYHNSVMVYKRERESCNIGLFTHAFSLFLIVLPHVLVSAVLTAVIFVPWVGLNSAGEAWGFFIFDVFLVMMCADIMVMAAAAVFTTVQVQMTVLLVLFLIQFLASSIFPGTNLGIQLPLNVVSFTAWGYRGLLYNEFTEDPAIIWGCPGVIHQGALPPNQDFILGTHFAARSCQLTGTLMRYILIKVYGGRGLWGGPKWYAAYILIGIYIFWTLVFIAGIITRCSLLRSRKIKSPSQQVPEVELGSINDHDFQGHLHHNGTV